MDLINSYCHSVYLSVLMNPANQRGWSDLISRDLIDKFHSHLAVFIFSSNACHSVPLRATQLDFSI